MTEAALFIIDWLMRHVTILISNDELLEANVELLVPAALENVITNSNKEKINLVIPQKNLLSYMDISV